MTISQNLPLASTQLISIAPAQIRAQTKIEAPKRHEVILNPEQAFRVLNILFRQEPYIFNPKHIPGYNFPTISFRIPDLVNFIKKEFLKREIYREDPWLVGGAASHVISGIEYGDVDLCFYLKKSSKVDELSQARFIVYRFIKQKLAFLGYPDIPFKVIDDAYLYKKIRLDGFVWINFGDIDLKFLSSEDHRKSVSATDGFHVSLSYLAPTACCVDRFSWCDQSAFDLAVSELKCRRLVIKDVRILHDIVWRLTHKNTQGYSIISGENFSSSELSTIAWKQIFEKFPLENPKSIENFKMKLSTHQENHYQGKYLGKMVDFFNLLSFLVKGLSTDPSTSALQNKYIQILVQSWRETSNQFDPAYNCGAFTYLIEKYPHHLKDLLRVVKGIFFLSWIASPKVSAYTFPFAENAQTPRLHIGLPQDEKLRYYLQIEGSPITVAKQFLDSWKKLESIYARNGDEPLFKVLGVNLGSPFPDLNSKTRIAITKVLSKKFLVSPVTDILINQYKGSRDPALPLFYEFLAKELGDSNLLAQFYRSAYVKNSPYFKSQEALLVSAQNKGAIKPNLESDVKSQEALPVPVQSKGAIKPNLESAIKSQEALPVPVQSKGAIKSNLESAIRSQEALPVPVQSKEAIKPNLESAVKSQEALPVPVQSKVAIKPNLETVVKSQEALPVPIQSKEAIKPNLESAVKSQKTPQAPVPTIADYLEKMKSNQPELFEFCKVLYEFQPVNNEKKHPLKKVVFALRKMNSQTIDKQILTLLRSKILSILKYPEFYSSTESIILLQSLIIEATEKNLLEKKHLPELANAIFDASPKDLELKFCDFVLASISFMNKLVPLGIPVASVKTKLEQLIAKIFHNKEYSLDKPQYFEFLQSAKQLFIEATKNENDRKSHLDKALLILHSLDQPVSNPDTQRIIFKCWLQGVGNLLLSEIPKQELQILFVESLSKCEFKIFNEIPSEYILVLKNLKNVNFVESYSHILFEYFRTMALLDRDLHQRFLTDPKLAIKMDATDFSGISSFLEDKQLTDQIEDFLKTAISFLSWEITPYERISYKKALIEITQKNPDFEWILQSLKSFIEGTTPLQDSLLNLRTCIFENDGKTIIQKPLDLLLSSALGKALEKAFKIPQEIILAQDIILFSTQLGILLPTTASDLTFLIIKNCESLFTESPELLLATEQFAKEIGKTVPNLNEKLIAIRNHFQELSVTATQALLKRPNNKENFELCAQSLYFALKSPYAPDTDEKRSLVLKLIQNAIDLKEGFELRNAYEIALIALKSKITFEEYDWLCFYKLALALMDLSPLLFEENQKKTLYRDLGLHLLEEISQKNDKINSKIQSLLLTKMFEFLIAVLASEKKREAYIAFLTAYSHLKDNQRQSQKLPSLNTENHSFHFRKFLIAALEIDQALAIEFVKNPNLKSRLSDLDYLHVQFQFLEVNNTLSNIEKYKIWKEVYSKLNSISLEIFLPITLYLVIEMAKSHPKEMQSQIFEMANGLIQILEMSSNNISNSIKDKTSVKIPLCIMALNKINAPKVVERLITQSRKCGLLYEQDVKNFKETVISSSEQPVTLHFINQFSNELESIFKEPSANQEVIKKGYQLILKCSTSSDFTLLEAAFSILVKISEKFPQIIWEDTKSALRLIEVVLKNEKNSSEHEGLLLKLLQPIQPIQPTKLLSDFDSFENPDYEIPYKIEYEELFKIVINSGIIWRSNILWNKILEVFPNDEHRKSFIMLALKVASESSDPKIFPWIQKEILEKDFINLNTLEEKRNAYLFIFENVAKLQADSDDLLRYGNELIKLWHTKISIMDGNPSEYKDIHSCLINLTLKTNNQELIQRLLFTFCTSNAEANRSQIWEVLKICKIPVKKSKRKPIEDPKLEIITKMQSSTVIKWHKVASNALEIYFDNISEEPKKLWPKLEPILLSACANYLLNKGYEFDFRCLLSQARKFFKEDWANCKNSLFKSLLSKTIFEFNTYDYDNHCVVFSNAFKQLMSENVHLILPNEMRQLLRLTLKKVNSSKEDEFALIQNFLQVSEPLFDMDKLVKKDRDNGLDQVALQRIEAESYYIESICNSKTLDLTLLLDRFKFLSTFVDLNIEGELKIFLDAALNVFDKVFFTSALDDKNQNLSNFLAHLNEIFKVNNRVNVHEFAARILRRIMLYFPAAVELKTYFSKEQSNLSLLFDLPSEMNVFSDIKQFASLTLVSPNVLSSLKLPSQYDDTLGLNEPSIKNVLTFFNQAADNEAIDNTIKQYVYVLNTLHSYLNLIVNSDLIKCELKLFSEITKSKDVNKYLLRQSCKILFTLIELEENLPKMFPKKSLVVADFLRIKDACLAKIPSEFKNAYEQLRKLGK